MTVAAIPLADVRASAAKLETFEKFEPFDANAFEPAPGPPRREWTPTDREQLVFRWVKFEGRTQGWVAEQLGIHQSTVSRMVERYEKWVAHGGPGRQGGLDHEERMRAQRWLTYERNEWIIDTALRVAAEMQKPFETTRSTVNRSMSNPSQEMEVSTVHMTVDQSGVANRFLRLAHRANMDNLTLVERAPLPSLEPLLFDDLGEPEDEQHLPRVVAPPFACDEPVAGEPVAGEPVAGEPVAGEPVAGEPVVGEPVVGEPVVGEPVVGEPVAGEPVVGEPVPPAMHSTHHRGNGQSLVNCDQSGSCNEPTAVGKPLAAAYAVASQPPEMVASPPAELPGMW